MLEIKDIVKEYKVNNQSIPVLKNISCTISEGEFVAILGPSGCGKSTLLNILSGLMKADSGEICFNGRDLQEFSEKEWEDYRKNRIGIVFQSFHLIPHLNILQNVELAMSVAAYDKQSRRKRAKELLNRVGLKNYMKMKPAKLSGGQKQRAAIARALANQPDIIFADEPTGALDSANSKEVLELLRSLNKKEGLTVVMVTHDEQIAAMADRNIRMKDGEIAEDSYRSEVEAKTDISVPKQTSAYKKSTMHFVDRIKVAGYHIKTKKRRTFLTVAGISVGIFSVMLMNGLTNGIANKASTELNGLTQKSVVMVETAKADTQKTQALKSALASNEAVDGIEEVYKFSGQAVWQEEAKDITVKSRTAQNKSDELMYGRYPMTDTEISVTETMAEKYMGNGKAEDFIGEDLVLYVSYTTENEITHFVEKTYSVVGVTSVNLFGSGNSYITMESADILAAASAGEDIKPQNTYIYLKTAAYRDKVVSEVEKSGFTITSSQDLVDTIDGWLWAIRDFLVIITGISLIVAVVMVVVVQYMSVAERTKEIGIMRAIGATKQEVQTIFLIEAGVMGLAAGIIGTGSAGMLGGIINEVIAELMQKDAFALYSMSIPVVIIGLLVSMLICLFAGYMPARQAAAVDTIEVLR